MSDGTSALDKKRVAIIGGGLVGSLQACFLAKRGFRVDLYEMRADIRLQEKVFGRSINLALSHRGREGLRAMGLEEEVLRNGIPMRGRMIHGLDGSKKAIYYGTKDQFIVSVDRRRLNELLLSAAEKYSTVQIHFDHKLVSCDLDKKEPVFESSEGKLKTAEPVDLIVGCDGAFSAIRHMVMKTTRMNYSQEFISHGYIELRIPPSDDNQFAMEKNYLHIWPRHEFMLIALPNVKDNSFVCTLFMPFAIFESLTNEEKVVSFFEGNFPDASQLIARESLLDVFFSLKPLALVSVKCYPYHVNDRAVLLGDAAHAMVPFYGQGLNCGFEDLLVFDDLMERYQNDFAKVLPEFSNVRSIDAHSINDLAMYNFVEMRSGVTSWTFLVRKKLDDYLFWLLPNVWVPLYTMVSFTRIRYHECTKRRQWQDKVLRRAVAAAAAGSVCILLPYFVFKTMAHKEFTMRAMCEGLFSSTVGILKTFKLLQ